jgi:hypothetical protein
MVAGRGKVGRQKEACLYHLGAVKMKVIFYETSYVMVVRRDVCDPSQSDFRLQDRTKITYMYLKYIMQKTEIVRNTQHRALEKLVKM